MKLLRALALKPVAEYCADHSKSPLLLICLVVSRKDDVERAKQNSQGNDDAHPERTVLRVL